jgi:hypothetical protein
MYPASSGGLAIERIVTYKPMADAPDSEAG